MFEDLATANKSDQSLAGHVAIVTGGARGIGRAIALRFAAAGARVVINYQTTTEAARATVRECQQLGAEALLVQADVQDEAAVQHLFLTATQLGTPSILVNNAGIADYGLLMEMPLWRWQQIISTNLTAAFLCTREAIPYLRRGARGRIINIASIHGLQGAAMEAAYAASKGGLIALTKSLAKELASLSITVNAIAPGIIATDMLSAFTDEERDRMAEQTPLGRLGQPADVAAVAHFLATDDAAFMTGQVLSPNGGLVT